MPASVAAADICLFSGKEKKGSNAGLLGSTLVCALAQKLNWPTE